MGTGLDPTLILTALYLQLHFESPTAAAAFFLSNEYLCITLGDETTLLSRFHNSAVNRTFFLGQKVFIRVLTA